MKKKALVLTPSVGFGELIRQLLEDTAAYTPILYANPAQALEEARTRAFDVTILDADFESQALPKLVAALRDTNPEMRIVVAPVEDRPKDPVLDELHADAILESPFYLPNLIEALEGLFGPLEQRDVRTLHASSGGRPPRRNQPRTAQPAPDWLADVSQAAQYLTRLTLESASQAALITRGEAIWAYAGQLPQKAADELGRAVAEHWEDEADLARFVHLKATGADYMMYATSLGGDYVLAMAFDAEMPFSQMRAQAGQMAEALTVAPQIEAQAARAAEEPQIIRMEAGGDLPPSDQAAGRSESKAITPGTPGTPSAKIQGGRSVRYVGADKALGEDSFDLHYAYAMIPRLPSHKLDGDLADKLAHWLPQLCLAFGWRLEHLNVQPDFLQWMVSMRPDASPDSVVHTLEQHLSDRIFEEFPRLRMENPSGKFWAPGFLIVSGGQPDAELMAQYIQQTRRRQGLPRNG
jgi:REP element-mobilizing transposase RayT/DNA-binding response OmpR family regulator